MSCSIFLFVDILSIVIYLSVGLQWRNLVIVFWNLHDKLVQFIIPLKLKCHYILFDFQELPVLLELLHRLCNIF